MSIDDLSLIEECGVTFADPRDFARAMADWYGHEITWADFPELYSRAERRIMGLIADGGSERLIFTLAWLGASEEARPQVEREIAHLIHTADEWEIHEAGLKHIGRGIASGCKSAWKGTCDVAKKTYEVAKETVVVVYDTVSEFVVEHQTEILIGVAILSGATAAYALKGIADAWNAPSPGNDYIPPCSPRDVRAKSAPSTHPHEWLEQSCVPKPFIASVPEIPPASLSAAQTFEPPILNIPKGPLHSWESGALLKSYELPSSSAKLPEFSLDAAVSQYFASRLNGSLQDEPPKSPEPVSPLPSLRELDVKVIAPEPAYPKWEQPITPIKDPVLYDNTAFLPKCEGCRQVYQTKAASAEKMFPPYQSTAFLVEGKKQNEALHISWINGINNTFTESQESARYIQELAGGHSIFGIYNHTNGPVVDLLEVGLLNYPGFSPNTAQLMKDEWTMFHEANKNEPDARLICICHSQGAIHVKNTLQNSPEDLRDRIIVVAIAPAAIVPDELCFNAYNYASEKDIIYKFDPSTSVLSPSSPSHFDGVLIPTLPETDFSKLVILPAHPGAKGIDHEFASPTYAPTLIYHLDDYQKHHGKYKPQERGKK